MSNAASIPAPIGGWNARDSLDDMDANDAVSMINLIPRSGWVEARRGLTCINSIGPKKIGSEAFRLSGMYWFSINRLTTRRYFTSRMASPISTPQTPEPTSYGMRNAPA